MTEKKPKGLAARVCINGTPYLTSVDENGRTKLAQDYKTLLNMKPVCARKAPPKQKWAKAKPK